MITTIKYLAVAILAIVLFLGLTKPTLVKSMISSDTRYVVELGVYDDEAIQGVFEALKVAKKGDVVDIFVNSPGGSVAIKHMLTQLIANSPATVNYHIASYAMSAAAYTICDLPPENITLLDDSLIMYHQGRIMNPDGTFTLLKDMAAKDPSFEIQLQVEKIGLEMCRKYLTEEEIQRINDGEDVYITGQDFRKRLHNLITNRATKQYDIIKQPTQIATTVDIVKVSHKVDEDAIELGAIIGVTALGLFVAGVILIKVRDDDEEQ